MHDKRGFLVGSSLDITTPNQYHMQVMQAVILAAGFSTRLYPLTEFQPKGLLKIGGKAIIEYLLDDLLASSQLDEIILVTNHHYLSHFQDFLKSNPSYARIKLVDDGAQNPKDRLGALGDLLFLYEKKLLKTDVLVCPSDTISSVKIDQLIDAFKTTDQFTTVVYDIKDKSKVANKLGCVTLRDGKVTEFVEKPKQPKSTYVGVPFYVYPFELLGKLANYQETGRSMDAPGSIIEWLIEQGIAVNAHLIDGYYHDVGTLEVYRQLAQDPSFLEK